MASRQHAADEGTTGVVNGVGCRSHVYPPLCRLFNVSLYQAAVLIRAGHLWVIGLLRLLRYSL